MTTGTPTRRSRSSRVRARGVQDISVQDGVDLVEQCLNAGMIDKFRLHVIPLLLGEGTKLFENLAFRDRELSMTRVTEEGGVLHLQFRVGTVEG